MSDMLASEKNYVLNNIFLKFSVLSANKQDSFFSDIFNTTSSFVLAEFMSTEEKVEKSLEDLVSILNKKGNKRFSNQKESAKPLNQAAVNLYRLDKVVSKQINLAITSSMNCIKAFKSKIKNYDALANLKKDPIR